MFDRVLEECGNKELNHRKTPLGSLLERSAEVHVQTFFSIIKEKNYKLQPQWLYMNCQSCVLIKY